MDLGLVTLIYGRNGTGKSSICKLIAEDLNDKFKVCIFDGFGSVLSVDNRLNAIALGRENSQLQEKINQLTERLVNKERELLHGGEIAENIRKAEGILSKISKSKDAAIRKIAKEIKNKENPRIDPNYHKGKVEKDLKGSTHEVLEKSSYEVVRQTASMQCLEPATQFVLPEVDLSTLFHEVNEILQRSITPSILIAEFENNLRKQKFASLGCEVHDRRTDKHCAFCGGSLTDERWKQLDAFFNDASASLKKDIREYQGRIGDITKKLVNSRIEQPDKFYPEFDGRAVTVRSEINELIAQLCAELEELSKRLGARLNDEFTVQPRCELQTAPERLEVLGQQYCRLVQENNEYGNNFEVKRSKAVSQLLSHWLATLSSEHGVLKLMNKEEMARKELDKHTATQDQANDEVGELKQQISKLRGDIKDENKAADHINVVLNSLGVDNFTLVRVERQDVGFYQVKNSHDGSLRNITELSTGEKNFIAFLYFIHTLNAPREDHNPRLIIFDDPMTSNDDIYQYAIISQLHNLQEKIFGYSGSGGDGLVILTHNTHFYLNVFHPTFKWKKACVYNLRSSRGQTYPYKVERAKDNIKTAYQSLWHDLYFAYQQDRPNLMWNTLRRIVTTYLLFEGLEKPGVLQKEAQTGGLLGRILQKSFNVNSHEILDFETESNRATVGEIRDFVCGFFTRRGNSEHFEAYWSSHSEQSPT